MSRRRSIFTTAPDIQVNLKQQEDLSNEIDQNLRTLALVHPFSDAAKPLLVKGAFLKANKPAFQHIVHFLIMIISAATFRKRFRWPILSSSEESAFRSAALVYFNDCHSQFKWNFGPFKMQTVLFPGGVEFMKIIVELSKIAMHTILKEENCLHLINSRGMTLSEAQAKLKAAEESFAMLEQFRCKVRAMSKPLKESTERLKELRHRILSNPIVSIPENLIDNVFLGTWKSNQLEKIDGKVLPMLKVLDEFASRCDSFQQLLMQMKPQQLEFDKEKFSALDVLNESHHFDPKIDLDKLLKWFKDTMPDIISAVYYKPPWSLSNLQRESQILSQITLRTDDLLNRINFLIMDSKREQRESDDKTVNESLSINVLNDKLIMTPIINATSKKQHRIAIWEAIPSTPTKNIINIVPFKVEKMIDDAPDDSRFDKTQTTSTKLDPILMLTALHRKGLNKTRIGSRPNRTSTITTSPAHLNNNNTSKLSSTMIADRPQSPVTSRLFTMSPVRKGLF